MMSRVEFDRGITFLEENGINLVAIFDLNDLPDRLHLDIKKLGIEIKAYQRLVLLGHSGRTLWKVLKDQDKKLFDSNAPIDQFSQQISEYTVKAYWGDVKTEMLYPGDNPISLQQLGKMAGWHHDSPMGVGINEEHGLWFAYRALFLIDAPLPLMKQPQGVSPCESCFDAPCVVTCPATALSSSESFKIERCSQFRIKSASPCRDRCLARESCSVASEQRYNREQISYHYLQSLAVIQEYYP